MCADVQQTLSGGRLLLEEIVRDKPLIAIAPGKELSTGKVKDDPSVEPTGHLTLAIRLLQVWLCLTLVLE